MVTDSEEEEEERETNEEEENPMSSDGEGGLSPVAMTTPTGLIENASEVADIQTATKQESPHQQQHGDKGL